MNAATNRAPRWERRKESRPAELLAAALDMFVDKGYAATRLDDVAGRAGVSKGTLYLYYPSKEELFKAVVRETIVPKIDAYRREVETSAAPAEQLLTNFFDAWWQHFGATELAGIIKLVVAEAGNFPEVARFFQEEVVAPNDDLLRTIVQRGVDRGEFKPIDIDAAVHIWIAPMVLKAIWMNSVEQVCPMRPDMTAERVLHAQLSMILDAIRTTRPRIDRIPPNALHPIAMDIERARFNMIEQQIRPWDVLDQDVLSLLGVVKREQFVPAAYRAMAFTDMEIPLLVGGRRTGETMLAPKVEARLLQAVMPRRHEQAVEVGAGSGYMAALLGCRARQVVSLELVPELADFAQSNLRGAGVNNVSVENRSGVDPAALFGDTRFDVVVLSGAVAFVPDAWLQQLNVGGRLAAIVGELPVMTAQLVTRTGPATFETRTLFDTVAKPLVGFPERDHFRF